MKKVIDTSKMLDRFAFQLIYKMRRMEFFYSHGEYEEYKQWYNEFQGLKDGAAIMGIEYVGDFTNPEFGKMLILKYDGAKITYRVKETDGSCTSFNIELFDVAI